MFDNEARQLSSSVTILGCSPGLAEDLDLRVTQRICCILLCRRQEEQCMKMKWPNWQLPERKS